MTKLSSESRPNVWRRRFYLLLAAWMFVTLAMSFRPVRGIVAYPLYRHDVEASGEAAYVMADGAAYWERLRAASDLYHWERISRIIVLEETRSDGWNFVRKKSDSRFQRTIDYLGLFGVPRESISSIPEDEGAWLGSLNEAQALARTYPDLTSVVVVTSAPHTRRSLLCFERSLPAEVKVQVYSASEPQYSSEIAEPIWVEYTKLVLYFFLA